MDELLERATALKYADAEVSTSKPAMDAIERSSKRLKLTAKEMSDVGASLASGEGKEALLGFARALGLDESSVRVERSARRVRAPRAVRAGAGAIRDGVFIGQR